MTITNLYFACDNFRFDTEFTVYEQKESGCLLLLYNGYYDNMSEHIKDMVVRHFRAKTDEVTVYIR